MKNILLVCTGNTCRSAMAEAMLDDAVDRSSKLSGNIRIDSAGTFACEDAEATKNAIRVMDERGLNIERHKAKPIDQSLITWADLILAMEAVQLEQIEAMFPEAESKMHLMLAYANGIDGFISGKEYEIKDPFGDDADEYRNCADQLSEVISKLIDRLEREI